jgi:cytochrome c2
VARSDASEDPEELMRLKHEREVTFTLEGSALETRQRELDVREKSLMTDRKKIGPNLKEVKAKLRKEWLPEWIRAPHEFRPDTKMPTFRLSPEQTREIAAFIWQRSLDVGVPKQEPGSAERGKELFEKRGCLGCHTMGEGDQKIGDGFSANLSRVGEKAHYDYLVKWIHDPTQRLLPYCPTEKRDIGPKDYEAKGLPFRFDVDHSRCPSCGRELQWRQMTVMPDFRLTVEEARDIATYLKSLRKVQDGDYPQDVAYLEDPAMKAKGEVLVRHFGCAGCHEISGMEDENRIGTDLTEEGSKPIERLDFGLLTHDAKDAGWYNHKGFFEQKLAKPEVFDKDKVKEDELEKLRMPNPRLTPDDIEAITTYLLGSVKSPVPTSYHYAPNDQRAAISEGWWVIKKYNCVGCHSVVPDQEPKLWELPVYAGENAWKRPPSLVGEGARVNPDWLARFLANPALADDKPHQNGVRTYLDIRMPTFHLSPNEIGKLVRFFRAMAGQPASHVPGDFQPLAGAELQMARDAFDSNQCLKCHPTEAAAAGADLGGAIAPNLLLARERLNPRWVERFIVDPAKLMPGTKMPAGLFNHDSGRWVIAGQIPKSMEGYGGDHRSLFIRYLDQLTESELKRK